MAMRKKNQRGCIVIRLRGVLVNVRVFVRRHSGYDRQHNGVAGAVACLSTCSDPLSSYGGPERRSKPRICKPFPVRVRGVDKSGHSLDAEALLENLSAGGLYFCLPHNVERGTKLFLILRIPSLTGEGEVIRVAVRGIVLRAEFLPEGNFGLAVAIRHHRILWNP